MANTPLAELSTENLTKRRDLLKGVLIAFSIFWVLLIGLAIYFYIAKAKATLFIPLMVFPITLLPLFLQLKPLQTELKNRKQP
ncbi:hypothetical protein [Pedobacter xixiisoli]|uniref:Redox-active disulfide protein 2 n=1 Tax=Pedobacter xixiisoli TaxID=1476464 RepID=A0A285ZXH0_9SPHI|nr:hypothetical protein [Pedobacter xixiisoli]SOD14346.1 hypothetical protein SAMN06297358_1528 [Pedobacter xixiisoli]